MKLSGKHISEFQILYEKHFGTKIGKDEALKKGLLLIYLMETIAKNMAKQQPIHTVSTEQTKRV